MMARPLAVFMRARKPWVFLRWIVEGWKVRFMLEAKKERQSLKL